MPSSSIATYNNGDKGELMKKRAMLPARPRLCFSGAAFGSEGGMP